MASNSSKVDDALPRLSLAGFGAAWLLFWLLMTTVAVQDHLARGHTDLWRPLLWEGSSALVATLQVAALWRWLHRADAWLHRPTRWFARGLALLPLAAPLFVLGTYGLRHAVYAGLGLPYTHEPWPAVFLYEGLKFSLFYLLFAAVVFGVRSHAALAAARLRIAHESALAQRAQLLQLAQQIEPHFLFNALNTIAAAVHTDADLADSLLTQLAALLRAATDLKRRPQCTLAEELRLVQGYTAIMCRRFADRVSLHFDIAAQAQTCIVPTLLLQPLLENAFTHGVQARLAPTHIEVVARVHANTLCIEVRNDAPRLPAALVFGVGLGNLRERLALLGAAAAALSLSQSESGIVIARIMLPCVSASTGQADGQPAGTLEAR